MKPSGPSTLMQCPRLIQDCGGGWHKENKRCRAKQLAVECRLSVMVGAKTWFCLTIMEKKTDKKKTNVENNREIDLIMSLHKTNCMEV